jgi:hypothetical protein
MRRRESWVTGRAGETDVLMMGPLRQVHICGTAHFLRACVLN